MNVTMLFAFFVYFCILTGIGLLFYRRTRNSTDFMLGGRSLNYFVTAIAAQASDMSSWLFLAFPAQLYVLGLFELWTAIGLTVFTFLNWQFIAPRLRAATEHYDSLTLSSYFNSRFQDKQQLLGLVSAFISIVFFAFYITSGLVGLGRIFESVFGISYQAGLVLGLISALGYTLVGGFFAVAWCNLFQGLFLLAMLLFVPVYAYFFVGGWSAISAAASAKGVALTLFPANKSVLHSLLLVGGWGLGYFGQPHILVYFMGINDVRNIRYAKYVGIAWLIIALAAAAGVGLVGLAYFANQAIANPELLFVVMAKELFPALLAGFVLCGIFAATLSTMNSHILISGSVFATDVYKRLMHPHAAPQHLVNMSRLGSLIISLGALVLAFGNTNTLYDLVNYAWAGLGSAFGPVLIASLYWTRATKAGALTAMILGAVVSGIWPYLNTGIMPLIPGFFVSTLAVITVSLLTAPAQRTLWTPTT